MFNFQNVCCICLRSDNTLEKQTKDNNLRCIQKLIDVIPDMDFPELYEAETICVRCINQVNDLHKFHGMCLRNREKIIGYIKNIKDGSTGNVEGESVDPDGDNGRKDPEGMGATVERSLIEGDVETEPGDDNCENVTEDVEEVFVIGDVVKQEPTTDDEYNDDILSVDVQIEEGPEMNEKTNVKTCKICKKSFTRISYLKKHMLIIHGTKTNQTENDVVFDKVSFKCQLCEKSFKSLQIYRRHLITHKGQRPYECELCKKSFTRSNDLKRHQKVHTKVREKCEICNVTFSRPSHYRRHKLIHANEQTFTCETCTKTFCRIGDFKRHQLTHRREYYKCEICKLPFFTENHYKKHLLVHMDKSDGTSLEIKPETNASNSETPERLTKIFTCTTCNRTFDRISRLKRHELTHTGERPYSCETCSKKFPEINSLKSHQLIHTGEKPYVCELCNKSFRHLQSFNVHYRIHTGDKPYECKYCSKSFADGSTLRKHQRIHTGEKPYMCEKCSKCFIQLIQLKLHRKSHL